MGVDLKAFLGKTSDLREWRRTLQSAVVCRLGGELGMVPGTADLCAELSAHAGAPTAENLDAVLMRGVHGWGLFASRTATVAFVSLFEFGDVSGEETIMWSGGAEVGSGKDIEAILRYFREHERLDLGAGLIDLGKYRTDAAAEKWAAEGILDDLVDGSESPAAALATALSRAPGDRVIETYVRALAATRLRAMGPDAGAAIPALLDALADPDWTIRIELVEALGSIGGDRPGVSAALAAVRNDKNQNDLVRQAAGEALGRLTRRKR